MSKQETWPKGGTVPGIGNTCLTPEQAKVVAKFAARAYASLGVAIPPNFEEMVFEFSWGVEDRYLKWLGETGLSNESIELWRQKMKIYAQEWFVGKS